MMMLSESARMTSAHEARFRITGPNARPRSVAVIALDGESGPWLASLEKVRLRHARFFKSVDLLADGARLAEAIGSADVAVFIATAGADQAGTAAIGAECSRRRVSTTALLHCPQGTADPRLMSTLRAVRPWMMMLVVVASTDYFEDVLRSMGA